jgi:hypothetical protein
MHHRQYIFSFCSRGGSAIGGKSAIGQKALVAVRLRHSAAAMAQAFAPCFLLKALFNDGANQLRQKCAIEKS